MTVLTFQSPTDTRTAAQGTSQSESDSRVAVYHALLDTVTEMNARWSDTKIRAVFLFVSTVLASLAKVILAALNGRRILQWWYGGVLLSMAATPVAAETLLLLCDQAVPEISAWDISGKDPIRRWAWVPADDPGIPNDQKKLFSHPTDVKPSRDGKHLIVCASGGGVALIALPELRCIWYAEPGGNPHSVASLTDDSLVVASSTGNLLVHYGADREEVARHTVESAHGATWDPSSERLLVLGSLHLHVFELRDGKLSPSDPIPLPVMEDAPNHARNGGHDLSPLPDTTAFLLTDAHHIWRYTPNASPNLELWKKLDKVKAISPNGPSIALVRATESWWTDEVRLLPDDRVLRFPGARIYKARWWDDGGIRP